MATLAEYLLSYVFIKINERSREILASNSLKGQWLFKPCVLC